MCIKKLIVDLSEQERSLCQEVVKKLKGTSQKVRRASILLKADSGWSDVKIAKALDGLSKTVENIWKRFVEYGFMEDVLDVYSRPYDAQVPVLCMDEQPVQLVQETHEPIAATAKHSKRVDHQSIYPAMKK